MCITYCLLVSLVTAQVCADKVLKLVLGKMLISGTIAEKRCEPAQAKPAKQHLHECTGSYRYLLQAECICAHNANAVQAASTSLWVAEAHGPEVCKKTGIAICWFLLPGFHACTPGVTLKSIVLES